jgi:hypothetical protein
MPRRSAADGGRSFDSARRLIYSNDAYASQVLDPRFEQRPTD